VVRVLYVVLLVIGAAATATAVVGAIVEMFSHKSDVGLPDFMIQEGYVAHENHWGTAIAVLFGAPVAFLAYALLLRMYLEMVIVIFRIAEYLGEISRRGPPL
jgi:hypothetical protein